MRTLFTRCDDANGRADKKLTMSEWTSCFGITTQKSNIFDILTHSAETSKAPETTTISSGSIDSTRKQIKHHFALARAKLYQYFFCWLNHHTVFRVLSEWYRKFSHKPKVKNCLAEKRYISECHRPTQTRSSLPLKYSLQNSLPVSSSSTSNCAAIPSCSTTNQRLWKRIQCDTESTLCWCVNPGTGDYDYNFRVKTGKDKNSKLKCREGIPHQIIIIIIDE